MPNLGPWGEALGKAISPALDAAGKAIVEHFRPELENKVFPVVGDLVSRASGGTKIYHPPILDPEVRAAKYAQIEEAQKAREKAIEEGWEEGGGVVRIEKSKMDKAERDLDTNPLRVDKDYTATGHLQATNQPRRISLSDPISLFALKDKLLNPLNQAEVDDNLDIIMGAGRLVRKTTPPQILQQLPPAAQGLFHLLGGDGKTTDLGMNPEHVRSNPMFRESLHGLDIDQIGPSQYVNVIETARRMSKMDEFKGLDINSLVPVDTSGPLSNAVAKAFLRQNPDGSWDLIDDYRFFNHVEGPGPHTKGFQQVISDEHAANYKNTGTLVPKTVKKVSASYLRPHVNQLLKLIPYIENKNLREKMNLKLGNILGKFDEWENFNPSSVGIDYHVDKWFVDRGTPYAIVMKNIDQTMAEWKVAQQGASSDPKTRAAQVIQLRNNYRNSWSKFKTVNQYAEVALGRASENGITLGSMREHRDFWPYGPPDTDEMMNWVTPLEKALWKYAMERMVPDDYVDVDNPNAKLGEALVKMRVAQVVSHGTPSVQTIHQATALIWDSMDPKAKHDLYLRYGHQAPERENFADFIDKTMHEAGWTQNSLREFEDGMAPYAQLRMWHGADTETHVSDYDGVLPLDRAIIWHEMSKHGFRRGSKLTDQELSAMLERVDNRQELKNLWDDYSYNERKIVNNEAKFMGSSGSRSWNGGIFKAIKDYENNAYTLSDGIRLYWQLSKDLGESSDVPNPMFNWLKEQFALMREKNGSHGGAQAARDRVDYVLTNGNEMYQTRENARWLLNNLEDERIEQLEKAEEAGTITKEEYDEKAKEVLTDLHFALLDIYNQFKEGNNETTAPPINWLSE